MIEAWGRGFEKNSIMVRVTKIVTKLVMKNKN